MFDSIVLHHSPWVTPPKFYPWTWNLIVSKVENSPPHVQGSNVQVPRLARLTSGGLPRDGTCVAPRVALKILMINGLWGGFFFGGGMMKKNMLDMLKSEKMNKNNIEFRIDTPYGHIWREIILYLVQIFIFRICFIYRSEGYWSNWIQCQKDGFSSRPMMVSSKSATWKLIQ